MELREKINLIIEESGLSSSSFADYIKISRPIISHILSGRNKPSWDVLQAINDGFPELGTDWMLDKNQLDLNKIKKVNVDKPFDLTNENSSISGGNYQDLPLFEESDSRLINKKKSHGGNLRISRIVVFYENGTFQEFKNHE